MADGAVALAAVESSVVDTAVDTSTENVDTSTDTAVSTEQKEKLDGRNQPDSLRKRISDLRRQAETITDPTEKASLLADAKALNDTVGKGRAYETVFPTVREARETKAIVESFGGREGILKAQETISRAQQIDRQLESGDPAV